MACAEEANISISKTKELLLKAQLLMRDIEEMLNSRRSKRTSSNSQDQMIQQECEANVEQDMETLVIDGMRFESVSSREDLRRLSSQAAAAATARATHDDDD